MRTLQDYLDRRTLQMVQRAFSAVAGRPVGIYAPTGQPLVEVEDDPAAWDLALGASPAAKPGRKGALRLPRKGKTAADIPVHLHERVIGRVRVLEEGGPIGLLGASAVEPHHERLLRLMARMLTRLCQGGLELRRRIEQLLALQQVMSQISGVQSLQQVLDAVTRTTVEVMKAQAGSIRLLSEDRQELVIRSFYSASPQYLDVKPIPISESPLDRETLQAREPIYVADMTTDPRVIYHDEAQREGLVSGLCAPIIFKNHRQGVLRVFVGKRHVFDWFERRLFQAIADSAAAAIANARLYEEAVESWELKRQVAMASEVQLRMIPHESPTLDGFDIHARYIPSQELAGDFYDFIRLPEGNLGVAVCDVVGKGVRASLLMASIRASLRAHASNVYEMSDVLRRVNRDLCADTLTSDFATLFYGVLSAKTRILTYSCAGHMPPILVRKGQAAPLPARGGGVLGLVPDMKYPRDSLRLEPGDVVMAYTDGLTDAVNFVQEPYGRSRLEKALLDAVEQKYSAEAIAAYCLWDLRRFAGLHRRADDRTIVVIKAL